tara:strand:+ start:481 stop:819 length:339 start_codon:yes stop_codon:yes gene_type:complete
MIWPPLKAWTSKSGINGMNHFVAINYGGKLLNRWVVLMSVLDASVVVRLYWSQLLDSSNWESGWDDINNKESYKIVNTQDYEKITEFSHPSFDSGLTIPISKNSIRPWFGKI